MLDPELAGVPCFVFSWEQEGCPRCGDPLQVRLTRPRIVHSLRYGTFLAVERQGYCPQHPDLPAARSRQLARIVAPGCNMGYDLIARVGFARFLECRQCEEIQAELDALEVKAALIQEQREKLMDERQGLERGYRP